MQTHTLLERQGIYITTMVLSIAPFTMCRLWVSAMLQFTSPYGVSLSDSKVQSVKIDNMLISHCCKFLEESV